MLDPQKKVAEAQTLAYWRRHSLLTFIALSGVSLVAFFIQPKGLPLMGAAIVGGGLIYCGGLYRTWWGTAIFFIGLALPAWVVWELAPSRPLTWIQSIAPMFATFLGLGLRFGEVAPDESV